METRANFAMIGAFTLAVIAGAFLFVLWFSGGSKTATTSAGLGGSGGGWIAYQMTTHRYTIGILRISSMKTISQAMRRSVYAISRDPGAAA